MTTHVFIVDEVTFKYHLNYLFAGTGAKDKDVDFNGIGLSALYPGSKHAAEAGLVAMMADCSRIREGDYIIFYLQATLQQEGRFYGIFQAEASPFLDRNDGNQFLCGALGKNLTFRVRIKPYEVYPNGVTEWKALDEIRNIPCPCQMLWSLIYRKLKGNRGNTMITIYESERLIDLIRRENNYTYLPFANSYDYSSGQITSNMATYTYSGRQVPFNILPRLIAKHQGNKSHEAHLQMYVAQNVGRNDSLDTALGILNQTIEWIGNEVSCGVGMQRIDIMLSKIENPTQRIVLPVELKAVPASEDNIRQISRYIDWIEQYYIPNRTSTIEPVLICRPGGLTPHLIQAFRNFNAAAMGRHLPLRYIEYEIVNNDIVFTKISY